MAIEAPYSKYRKQNLLIVAGVCLVAGIIFGYDGYLSKYEWSKRNDFYKEHVIENDGVPDGTMVFNQKSPPFFIGAALAIGICFFVIKDHKITVDETTLMMNSQSISLDSIEKIDKSHFDKKGYFIITYTDNGQAKELKLSDRAYDNMPAVLDHIVAKIS